MGCSIMGSAAARIYRAASRQYSAARRYLMQDWGGDGRESNRKGV